MLHLKVKRVSATGELAPPPGTFDDRPNGSQIPSNSISRRPNIHAGSWFAEGNGSERDFQTRVPVITGEVTCKGMVPVDGIISGQIGGNGGTLSVRQRAKRSADFGAELSGEIRFKDLIRVNGHIAGSVYSSHGTLIVDSSARVDADVEVAVAVIGGTVKGDIIARQRVEVGPSAKIYGNIWTRSIAIQRGAVFEGVCRMLDEEHGAADLA